MDIQTVNCDLLTTWRGGLASRTQCHSSVSDLLSPERTNHSIDSDEPEALGGKGLAPNPHELMLAAFNACMTASFVQEALREEITLTHLEIQTSGQLLTGLPLAEHNMEQIPGRLQYVIRVSGQGTVRQYEQIHQRVINASLNRWLLAQSILVEGDLVLC